VGQGQRLVLVEVAASGLAAIRAKVVDEVYATKGIPRQLLTSDLPQEMTEAEEDAPAEVDAAGESAREGVLARATGRCPLRTSTSSP